MNSSRHKSGQLTDGVALRDRLVEAGLEASIADVIAEMPQRRVQLDPRRPFREPGAARDEVMFVATGLVSKYKADSSGRRQIVALRFPGEGILPREGSAAYGIQAIVKSEVLVGKAEDFDPIIDAHPALARFFWRLIQRNESIGYEWLVNCGRRDSTARVAHLLAETATRYGIDPKSEPLPNPFTQQQIADITGQTSVNVNRVFADLERQGLISRQGRNIHFRDWNEMLRVASFQPGYLD
ncbi:MAG: Crp/Fnr family transcriptional regulator [Sphingomicrobium sp.]